MFIDFSRLDENAQRNPNGTGLGLSICKKIVETMGGSINVESTEGKGTDFQITINTMCKVPD